MKGIIMFTLRELSSHPSIYRPERNYDGVRCVSACTTTTFCSIQKSMDKGDDTGRSSAANGSNKKGND
ncbi:hypothetical protein V6N12_046774 [Hibiscus sabdariffa]|uniref:Uncharacterized protein n=1 Tax=Hibiscus sabdariffa TaxID=183260 RepID=A0ABR2AXT2_9ROSI